MDDKSFYKKTAMYNQVKELKDKHPERFEEPDQLISALYFSDDSVGFQFYRPLTIKEFFYQLFFGKKIDTLCRYTYIKKTKKWHKLKNQPHNEIVFHKALNEALKNSEFAKEYY